MPDPLALAAALIARGMKPPVYVEDLAGLYRVHAQDPVPPYVLSPQLARFLEDLEKKHRKETPE